MSRDEQVAACLCEYRGQLATGHVVRRFLFMRRVRLTTERGYFLAWLPSWRVAA